MNKKSKKKIHINGNVKSKHKQYDHWHSQDFQQGAKARERSDRVGEWCMGGIFCTLNFWFSLSNQWGGGGAGPLYPLIATPVAVV